MKLRNSMQHTSTHPHAKAQRNKQNTNRQAGASNYVVSSPLENNFKEGSVPRKTQILQTALCVPPASCIPIYYWQVLAPNYVKLRQVTLYLTLASRSSESHLIDLPGPKQLGCVVSRNNQAIFSRIGRMSEVLGLWGGALKVCLHSADQRLLACSSQEGLN